LNLIKKIQNGNISDEEVQRVKTNTKADFIFSMESSSGLASLFGSYYAKGSIKPLIEYEEKINSLTKEDIISVAKKYLITENSTTVILRKE